MMCANLVGFVVGTDGVSYLVGQLLGSWTGMSSVHVIRMFLTDHWLCHLFVKGFNLWSGLVPVYSLECNSCLNIGRRRCGEVYIADVDGCII